MRACMRDARGRGLFAFQGLWSPANEFVPVTLSGMSFAFLSSGGEAGQKLEIQNNISLSYLSILDGIARMFCW